MPVFSCGHPQRCGASSTIEIDISSPCALLSSKLAKLKDSDLVARRGERGNRFPRVLLHVLSSNGAFDAPDNPTRVMTSENVMPMIVTS
jgi:hypothetical protein